jgi:hypothetical protein
MERSEDDRHSHEPAPCRKKNTSAYHLAAARNGLSLLGTLLNNLYADDLVSDGANHTV